MVEKKYRLTRVPKGTNTYRTIYVPSSELKEELRRYLPSLNEIHLKLDPLGLCHAFIKGRNCVTNANKHIGFSYTLSFDIKDFFDSVQSFHLAGKVPQKVINDCLINGAPRQGLPTSPLLASIALIDVDQQIVNWLSLQGIEHRYTRYADDISISLNDRNEISKIQISVEKLLTSHGFTLNTKKTSVQSRTNGRVIITGVAVDVDGVYPTRKTLRKIRAAIHQRKWRSGKGLREWSKCKLPNGAPKEKRVNSDSYIKITHVYSKLTTCSLCEENKLAWATTRPGCGFLVDKKSLKRHRCETRLELVTQSDLGRQLMSAGFTEISMASKTWSNAFSFKWSNLSLLVLLRKNGVDICVFNSVYSDIYFDAQSKGSIVGARRTYKYDYADASVILNINKRVLDAALDCARTDEPDFSYFGALTRESNMNLKNQMAIYKALLNELKENRKL